MIIYIATIQLNLTLRILLILKCLLLTLSVTLKSTTKEDYTIKLNDKRDDFLFPIVNIPFLSSDIPEAPVYGVYISQLIGYSRACAQYSDFLDRAQLLTQTLLKQGYVAPRLKLPLQQLYGRHHNLVDHYEISISQMTMGLLLFNVDVFFPLSDLKVI